MAETRTEKEWLQQTSDKSVRIVFARLLYLTCVKSLKWQGQQKDILTGIHAFLFSTYRENLLYSLRRLVFVHYFLKSQDLDYFVSIVVNR